MGVNFLSQKRDGVKVGAECKNFLKQLSFNMSRDKIDDLSRSLTFVTLFLVFQMKREICWKWVFVAKLKNISLLDSFINGNQCARNKTMQTRHVCM